MLSIFALLSKLDLTFFVFLHCLLFLSFSPNQSKHQTSPKNTLPRIPPYPKKIQKIIRQKTKNQKPNNIPTNSQLTLSHPLTDREKKRKIPRCDKIYSISIHSNECCVDHSPSKHGACSDRHPGTVWQWNRIGWRQSCVSSSPPDSVSAPVPSSSRLLPAKMGMDCNLPVDAA